MGFRAVCVRRSLAEAPEVSERIRRLGYEMSWLRWLPPLPVRFCAEVIPNSALLRGEGSAFSHLH